MGAVRRAADRYADWVDRDKGVTGTEKNVYGIFEIGDQSACIDGVKKSGDLEVDVGLEVGAEGLPVGLGGDVRLEVDELQAEAPAGAQHH